MLPNISLNLFFTWCGRMFVLLLLIFMQWHNLIAQEVLKVKLPNGDSIEYTVVYREQDSLNGKTHAVFAADTTVTAFRGSFINGKPNGAFLYYYPSGRYYQTCIYGYGNLHGDYTVYNQEGSIILKGQYKNGLKHGYWRNLDENLIGRYFKGMRHLTWKITNSNGKGAIEKWAYFRGVLKKGDAKSAELLRL